MSVRRARNFAKLGHGLAPKFSWRELSVAGSNRKRSSPRSGTVSCLRSSERLPAGGVPCAGQLRKGDRMDLLASQQPWDGPETGPADDDDDEMAALDALIAEAEADLSPQTKAAFSKPLQPSQPVDGGQWGSQQPSAAPRAEQAPSRKERDEPRDARTEPRQEKNSGPYSQLRPQLMNTEARPGFQARGGQAGAGKPKVAKPITGDSTVEKFSGLKIKCAAVLPLAGACLRRSFRPSVNARGQDSCHPMHIRDETSSTVDADVLLRNRVLPSIIVEERLRNIRVLPLRSVR